ncbi:hypothetical protein RvY_19346 [Ramazzottius varieornatus]|uniref:Uncharacterized protein n=1 Tax=Ramazzottius varieornatus TaxID=947166 RepID=A0A1D1W950_RAMVA|nr:hypothetical protein RvY_19346 [Ramazzottius varieornatus]
MDGYSELPNCLSKSSQKRVLQPNNEKGPLEEPLKCVLPELVVDGVKSEKETARRISTGNKDSTGVVFDAVHP